MSVSIHMGLSENSVPLNPVVLLINIPIKWLLLGILTQHFSYQPISIHINTLLWFSDLRFLIYLVWWFVSDDASIYCFDGRSHGCSRTWVWCSSSSTAKQPAEAAEAMTLDDLSRYPVPARYPKKINEGTDYWLWGVINVINVINVIQDQSKNHVI